MPLHVITANDTRAGSPTYLTASGTWSSVLSEAVIFEEDAPREEALARAKADQARVADPYVIDVSRDDVGNPVAASLRERIRATGPTVDVRVELSR